MLQIMNCRYVCVQLVSISEDSVWVWWEGTNSRMMRKNKLQYKFTACSLLIRMLNEWLWWSKPSHVTPRPNQLLSLCLKPKLTLTNAGIYRRVDKCTCSSTVQVSFLCNITDLMMLFLLNALTSGRKVDIFFTESLHLSVTVGNC